MLIKKKKTRPTSSRPSASTAPLRAWRIVLFGLFGILVAAYFFQAESRNKIDATPVALTQPLQAEYVGAQACTTCHAAEASAWQGSQHAKAMQEATEKTMLGDFNHASFKHEGVTSSFFRQDGKFMVRTDGPDGKLADFEVKNTFGIAPVQQYLVEFPDGRMQALGIAWDTRLKESGGQRWFHLYPKQSLKAGNPLHWTGIDQNWNYQCADCHSTNLRKGYDEQNLSFKTSSTDRSVGCESCHGPASKHLAWANKEGDWTGLAASKGLVVKLDECKGVNWVQHAQSGNAVRSRPRETNLELETCARCHARRGQFSDDWQPGKPFGDAFRAALIVPGLYHADGQQRDEVFNYGSFLQSKMHAQGVTCSDCHEPHGGKLRAEGNALCAQCHAPKTYDVAAHTHHAAGSPGAECASCHMPTTNYMVLAPRHDHSFRIPRPDRSVSMGVPNACNACHAKQTAKWAAKAISDWFPQPKPGFQRFAEAFHAGEKNAPGAQQALQQIADERAQPGIVRASAIARLEPLLSPAMLPTLRNALNDSDSLVRSAAVHALANVDAATRSQLLPRLLADSVRDVRMEAARGLAGEPEARLSASERSQFDSALGEFIAAQRFNAERPEAQAALGTLYAQRGDLTAAEAAYRQATALDPGFIQASINLADLYRAQERDSDAEKTLRGALADSPRSAPLHHALGLLLIRQKQISPALVELEQAVKLTPENVRFAYVYGIALNDTGKAKEAIRILEAALVKNPYNRDLLFALVSYQMAAGQTALARKHVKTLQELEPDNPEVAQMARGLPGASR
ncbi:MAG: multiheme c-type cytochrome [Sulfuricellaceae bacterium]|nr:multiheme c-type cytochrome [Sulfuricellaceae bacterium]